MLRPAAVVETSSERRRKAGVSQGLLCRGRVCATVVPSKTGSCCNCNCLCVCLDESSIAQTLRVTPHRPLRRLPTRVTARLRLTHGCWMQRSSAGPQTVIARHVGNGSKVQAWHNVAGVMMRQQGEQALFRRLSGLHNCCGPPRVGATS